MKVLVLSRYVARGASSRLRMLQYLPVFAGYGWACAESPLLDEAYLAAVYAGRKPGMWRLVCPYARRLAVLLGAWRYDRIWLEKELWPWAPGWLEAILLRLLPPAVIDYDDALFHNYDQHPRAICRTLFAGKIATVMRSAGVVVAGSRYVLDYAKAAGVRRIEYVPTVVDLARYAVAPACAPKPTCVVGWIGTPFTVKYLDLIAPALSALARQGHVLELRVIGAAAPAIAGVAVQSRPWSVDREAEDIAAFDVGVMPLEDSQWERGKCAYKLIQYMACGVPVVASPVGMNAEVVGEGAQQAGFLAADTPAWMDALTQLLQAPELRQRLGAQGRARVAAEYSLQVAAPRLAAIFNAVGAKGA